MFLFSLLKDNTKVNKKILEDTMIPLANENLDFKIDEYSEITKCKTGNFYYGKYNNKSVIIKKVDITNDELILDEFIFWKKQIGNSFYPKMIGVLIKYNYAYIIFEKDLKITNLKKRLNLENKFELSFENKIKIVRQLLNLLKYFRENNINHKGLRSSIIGIDSNISIKLFDYGDLVDLNTGNDKIEEIKDEINKYSPPEFNNNDEINENYDIYSFGQLLIDLFLNKDKIKKDNINLNEIINEENIIKILNRKINEPFANIILRCIEPDKNKRIKFDELNNNLQLVLDCYYNNNITYNENKIKIKENINENYLNENKNIKEFYQYENVLMNKMHNILEDVNNNLENKIKYLKNEITTQYEKTYEQFDIMEKTIKEILDKFIESSKKLIDTYYTKFLDSTINMQMDTYNNSLNDLYDIINLGDGILMDIAVFSNFKNHDKYKIIEEYFQKTKTEIEELLQKNSKNSEFDLIYQTYENKCNNYQNYCDINNECIESLKQIQNGLDTLVEKNNNKLDKILAIDLNVETIDKNSEYFKSMNDNIYAKIKENSNQIYIYNYFTKSISCHQIENDIIFNSNCYSFFDKEDNCIYVSGGQKNNDDYNNDENTLLKISINFIPKEKEEKNINNIYNIYNFGEYHFEIKKLNNLITGRSSHCMIHSIKDRNMLLNIGGKNTKTTEVYNLEYDKSANISDLPSLCPNPAAIEFNGCIYLFTNSEFNLNSVYLLDMNKFENFSWDAIQFNMNAGSLKRGMNIIEIDNTFYLFGGYDQNNEYSDIYKIDLNEEYLDINFYGNLALSHDSSFNSNGIVVNKKNRNKNIDDREENHKIIILMNMMNIVNEIDFEKDKLNYYELINN